MPIKPQSTLPKTGCTFSQQGVVAISHWKRAEVTKGPGRERTNEIIVTELELSQLARGQKRWLPEVERFCRLRIGLRRGGRGGRRSGSSSLRGEGGC
jgi:hypothetical protein